MDNETLKSIRTMLKEELEPIKKNMENINDRLDRIETDIKDIKVDVGSININIKETREDARSAELATAQNSFEIAQIKMRMKMA